MTIKIDDIEISSYTFQIQFCTALISNPDLKGESLWFQLQRDFIYRKSMQSEIEGKNLDYRNDVVFPEAQRKQSWEFFRYIRLK